MLGKVLIANRGEIALRILRACRELGIRAIVAHSEADRHADYVKLADGAVCVGPAPARQSYLNRAALLSAAEVADAQAIHPGYGFLAEDPEFAAQAEAAGFIFVGPRPESLRFMRNRIATKEWMLAAGIPCVPGPDKVLPNNVRDVARIAKATGYPVALKAAASGFGVGLRVVHTEAALQNAVAQARADAQAATGHPAIYLEKFLERPRQIEIQILADGAKGAVYLGERDCSLQWQGHKLVEEAPAPGIVPRLLARLGERCAEACRRLGFRGLATFEFLFEDEACYFVQMHSRLPVEHPLAECVTGIDLVQEQLRIAAGEKLRLRQRDITFRGHAIECRINALGAGTISRFRAPGGPGIRFDTHIAEGYAVPAYYDPLIGKLIACGETREQAIGRMRLALAELEIAGIETNANRLRDQMFDSGYLRGELDLHHLDTKYAV